ncbi:hypothetical protein [Nostoc sp. LPT]|nr:hypothetical protein [Nostoc sp. LPT]
MRQNRSLSAVILLEPTVIYLPFLLSDRYNISSTRWRKFPHL